MEPMEEPKPYEPKNRAQRRRLISKKVKYELVRRLYPPARLPISLGIQEYKRTHDDKKRIQFYKESMWKAHRDLKGA